MTEKPHIVIVGAGFGGLWATRELAKADVRVTLLDKNNYHAFLPLLYQVAAAELETEQIAHPVRSIINKHPNVSFRMSEATGVDAEAKTLTLRQAQGTETQISYDYLLLAMGSRQNFFGVRGAREFSYALKTIADSVRLRNQVLSCFEQAAIEPDEAVRRKLLTFVMVGGGANGVEYAGALAELVNQPLAKDYASIDFDEVSMILLEGGNRLLNHMKPKLSEYTRVHLEKMGVDVRLNHLVNEVSGEGVVLRDGSAILADTVVWTAGVEGATFSQWFPNLEMTRDGRVPILPTLQLVDYPEIMAVGDLTFLEQDGEPIPMLAQPAMQAGTHAGENFVRLIAGEAPTPFVYNNLGVMTVIGRNRAVAQVGGRMFTGFVAWVLWVAIHLFKLVGFRNRLVVLINWAWDYVFFERVARLIVTSAPVEEA